MGYPHPVLQTPIKRWRPASLVLALSIATAVTLFAGRALAQDGPLCAPYARAWARVGGGADIPKLRHVSASIPAACPVLKAKAKRRIRALVAESRLLETPVAGAEPGNPAVADDNAGAFDNDTASQAPTVGAEQPPPGATEDQEESGAQAAPQDAPDTPPADPMSQVPPSGAGDSPQPHN